MNTFKRVASLVAMVCTSTSIFAQSFGGALLDKDILTTPDLFNLSQQTLNIGTSRSMAMGGAFTSLGGDLSSMSINPAGLGMYQRSEFSFTPMIGSSNSETSNSRANGDTQTTKFSMSNIGLAFNNYRGDRGLVSYTLGVGYNRIADFNNTSAFVSAANGSTIADVYSGWLNNTGYNKEDFYGRDDEWNWDNISTDSWMSALAYKGFLVDQMVDGTWLPSWIGNNASVDHFTRIENSGSLGEYDFSAGFNFNNKLYIGATLGVQSLRYRQDIYYGEEYRYGSGISSEHPFGVDPNLDYQLLYTNINQAVILSGAGVNFKIGAIYRPIEALRIGFAFHTPTAMSVTRSFQGAISSRAYANNNISGDGVVPDKNGFITTFGDDNCQTPVLDDYGSDSWHYATPARMMWGVSYTIAKRAIVSVDYERSWYNGIRMQRNPLEDALGRDYFNDDFRYLMKGSNTLRVGAEVMVTNFLALRAGYGFNGSMLRNENTNIFAPMIKQTESYSAGLGIAVSPRVSFDLAYVHSAYKTTDYYLFYYDEGNMFSESALFSTKFHRNNYALTMNFNF